MRPATEEEIQHPSLARMKYHDVDFVCSVEALESMLGSQRHPRVWYALYDGNCYLVSGGWAGYGQFYSQERYGDRVYLDSGQPLLFEVSSILGWDADRRFARELVRLMKVKQDMLNLMDNLR